MATGATSVLRIPDEFGGPECLPDYDKLETEDNKPVDSLYSERQHLLLTAPLIESWKGPGKGRPFFVCTDVGLFYSMKKPPFAPDVLLSLDVAPPQGDPSLKENHSYFVWQHDKPPDALVEVVSNKKGAELTTKRKGFARIGVIFYIVWDPFQFLGKKKLHCFALERGKYVPCEPWFPELELGVKIWEGTYGNMEATFLRWCDATGELIPTGGERADNEGQRADQEKQRAEQEKQRADQEKQRADKLARKLKSLGVDLNGK